MKAKKNKWYEKKGTHTNTYAIICIKFTENTSKCVFRWFLRSSAQYVLAFQRKRTKNVT